ncbi:bile acid:sodium symporter family protein [Jannaschia marina]|uniref:bile acid:sodium symporter family protein n=1 Tax=Jannaschia marina TaxID=2741674 RepID=UPI0015CC4ABF|nr:bile acid:sodium symporter family protein [Jannaschia marina]
MGLLVSVGLPLALAFIMFSLGVGLTGADFRRVGQRPLAFLIGALNQVVLLPLVAFGVARAFGITGEIAVGLMILAACPGGVTSNIVSRLARGDVALSVSLTAVISLTSMVTVPLILGLSLNHFLGADAPPVNIVGTAFTMFLLTAVPIALALLARRAAPGPMMRAEPVLTRVATALFVLVIGGALAANWALFVENVPRLGPALVVLLVLLTTVGFVVPRLLGRTRMEAKTISVETGIQNGTLGIAVAALVVGGGEGFSAYALPSAVYGVLMYLILVPVVLLYRRMD